MNAHETHSDITPSGFDPPDRGPSEHSRPTPGAAVSTEELLAYADGELSPQRSADLLRRLEQRPDDRRRLIHLLELRQAVCQAMSEPRKAPAELAQRIEAMLAQASDEHGLGDEPAESSRANGRSDEPSPPTGPPLSLASAAALEREAQAETEASRAAAKNPRLWESSRPKRGVHWSTWSGWAVAAALALAIIGARMLPGGPAVEPVDPVLQPVRLVSAERLRMFCKRHVTCSTKIAHLAHTDRFPQRLEQLPKALRDYLNHPLSVRLDLSEQGYRFLAVGACAVPGEHAVHAVYRARAGAERNDRLSLWILPDRGEYSIEPGQLVRITDEGAIHPLLAWRRDGLMYFLMGDSSEHTNQVAQTMLSRGASVSYLY